MYLAPISSDVARVMSCVLYSLHLFFSHNLTAFVWSKFQIQYYFTSESFRKKSNYNRTFISNRRIPWHQIPSWCSYFLELSAWILKNILFAQLRIQIRPVLQRLGVPLKFLSIFRSLLSLYFFPLILFVEDIRLFVLLNFSVWILLIISP